MFKLIATSLGAKIITAVSSLLIVIIGSHYLGAKNMGDISLIVLAITIFIQINNIVGGGALVYLLPRHNTTSLLVLSYLWAIVTIFISTIVIVVLHLVDSIYIWHTVILASLFVFSNIHWMVFLAKERINLYNILQATNILLLLTGFSIFIFVFHENSVFSYIKALYIAYGLSFFLSSAFLLKHIRFQRLNNISASISELFRFGSIMQTANILQLFNYRFLYYLIEQMLGKTLLGIYSVGNQVSEGVWLMSNSASTVLYPKISNSTDQNHALRITLSFTKGIGIITLFIILVLWLLPATFYGWVFGQEFTSVKPIILSLSGGIFFLSLSKILSNYFSGIGKPQVNTVASGIGAVVLASLGYFFISRWHLIGAGLIASLTYFSGFCYQFIQLKKHNNLTISDFKLTSADKDFFRKEFKQFFKKSNHQ